MPSTPVAPALPERQDAKVARSRRGMGTGADGTRTAKDTVSAAPLPKLPCLVVLGVALSVASPAAAAPYEADRALLDAAVRFFGAQRSGDGANWALPPGTRCFMRDGEVAGIDLAGGWFDAGDHLISTMSTAIAAYRLLKTYDMFVDLGFSDHHGERYGPPNGVPDILDEAAWALDWLAKAHPDPDRLVHSVGGFEFDHSTWTTCDLKAGFPVEQGGEPRPIDLDLDMEGRVEAGADFAGMTAAALALGARLFATFDQERAAIYQAKAESVYELGKRRPTTSEGFGGQKVFGIEQWQDEMMCGAIELFRATRLADYASDAERFAREAGPNPDVPSGSHNHDLCWHSFFEEGMEASIIDYWEQSVTRHAGWVSEDPYLAGLVDTGLQWGTLSQAAAAAWSAGLFAEVTGDDGAQALALSQLDYILGDNGYGRSFVVGFGEDPPRSPHHVNAFGRSGWDAFHARGPHRVELKGALVGGPTRTSEGPSSPGYLDDVHDYVGNEVALHYNSSLVLLVAYALHARGDHRPD